MKICSCSSILYPIQVILFYITALSISPAPAVSAGSDNDAVSVPVYGYRVINEYPHDEKAFTQGLAFEKGFIYESTGLHSRSALRKIKVETGEVLTIHKLHDAFFGEGITIHENNIIQLTWRSNIGFVYDKENFKPLRSFHYATEGWGITYDGERLIMSDGTSYLYFLDPETFKETLRVEVRDEDIPVTRLNELEFVRGEIFANVWLTNRIVRIDPQSGKVTGWIDLGGLSPFKNSDSKMKELNGIAYDAKNDRLFVTGKLWPKIYEIKIIPAD